MSASKLQQVLHRSIAGRNVSHAAQFTSAYPKIPLRAAWSVNRKMCWILPLRAVVRKLCDSV